ncbi:uncharacterized protein LOC107713234 [Sinocyclocheilus rhinocerous]|uniref:uncharacterized protein LOC107713234 n=1 Tax=Sinocyclocheilus rhinocerous TaxID=307959 RepID=UPI0007B7942C|nr:PREDICTED: uncharacterized protein LOC107713234 [Sinocyclocheilus rhinocerous]
MQLWTPMTRENKEEAACGASIPGHLQPARAVPRVSRGCAWLAIADGRDTQDLKRADEQLTVLENPSRNGEQVSSSRFHYPGAGRRDWTAGFLREKCSSLTVKTVEGQEPGHRGFMETSGQKQHASTQKNKSSGSLCFWIWLQTPPWNDEKALGRGLHRTVPGSTTCSSLKTHRMTSGSSGFVENTASAAIKAFGGTFLGSSSSRGVFYSSRNSRFFQLPPSPGGTPALRCTCQTLQ